MAKSTTATRAMRQWALKGAATRLGELAAERTANYREFPQLRGRGAIPAANSQAAPSGASSATPPRRAKRGMSAAQRKAVSKRMRKYWAERRRATKRGAAQEGTVQATRAAAPANAAPRTKKRVRRTISAEARRRISEAQKARWAKQNVEKSAV